MVANDNDLYFDDDDGDEPLMLEDEAGLAEVLEACLWRWWVDRSAA